MSTKNLVVIDRFYIVLAIVMCVLSFLVIFTLKEVFTHIIRSNQIDESLVPSPARLDKGKLDKAYTMIFEKNIIPLD